ncbi:heme utilization cystosolic carrier protein HutX [Pontibaca methylaminivorans]|uniref:Heme utilization protein HuvX n=1 Tax=Pontibaca methylaminivorans TaxID=515897 RepID=A0A1R3X7G0_9RHOB|nr:heme utilization cystosolic carrier protein HutX [Pontibaca methylaminivorans]SIT86813.1 heme utilization protein HuvX [Pontibaca methylaminivorans]
MTKDAIRAAIAENPTGALEDIAEKAGVTPLAVLDALPEGEVVSLSGELFTEVMEDITRWGEITFIVNTPNIIFEVKAPVGPGEVGHGMFNLHDKAIGGHIHYRKCARIAFVRRRFFSMDTASVQFYAHDGSCMFKIYLGRDGNKALKPDQIAAMDALQARLLEGAAA